MENKSRLKQHLLALNNLVKRERTAIIYSQMKRLENIQHEKNTLLIMMQSVDKVMDQESFDLAVRIRKNNKRNALLLKAGFELIRGLRQDLNRRRSLTYSAKGCSRNVGICPKILKQSA